DAEPARGPRTGLHEMGLPYVSDPAITRHLAAFLKKHLQGTEQAPGAVLFNGGVFQPRPMRERLVEAMQRWYASPGHPWQPLILANPSLDLAVAWGAAYYGWLRHSGGRRIGGGIARSYYVAVGGAPTAPLPPGERGRGEGGGDKKVTVICVVPRQLEEGQDVVLDKPEVEL